MKKWPIIMLVLALFASGGTAAYAHGGGSGGPKDAKRQQQACNEAAARLNQVLAKTKDERARSLLKSMIASFKAQCAASGAASQDVKKVNADKDALAIQYLGGNSATNVTLPVILPSRGKNGSAVAWTSSNPNVISHDGLTVRRSAQGDVAVNLTASLRFHNATATRTFRVVVKADYPQLNDSDRVAKDKAALAIDYGGSDNAGSVTRPLDALPAKGPNGSSVRWISSLPAVVSNDGKTVNRPANGSGDAVVVLTAFIQSGAYADVKVFTVTVKQNIPDAQRVAADKAALAIDYGGSDNAGSVTRPLDGLPVRGANGSAIVWTSSSPGVLSADGKTLRRPAAGAGDAAIVLTAIITSGSASDVKVFVLIVKDDFTSQERAAADKADLAIAYKNGDVASKVTQALGLPTRGYYGSAIAWYSSNPSVVTANGTVYRPARGKGDAAVTLTAVVSSGGSAEVRSFNVVVKQQ
ncbi:immunoglobulin-like domain-containing protein [Paenibacillus sp. GCM10023250]|uniref:immunoglobulin-like domain-containing protein n=1 Tax=Paenibacillus sp. GCM10023250 TaxID=3252648 RepID=UPI003613A212